MSHRFQNRIEILHQDQSLVVIYKPENLLSVPYEGCRAKTALDLLENIMRKNGTYSAKHKPFAVHRLDRDTSGVMMFALNEGAKKKIMDDWQGIVTERIYRAVAEKPKNARDALPQQGVIDSPLAYNAYNIAFVPKEASSKGEGVSRPQNKFKTITAITNYKIIERGKIYTLFELSLETGRKNQIRAHLASRGYPIAGDKNYRAKTNPFGRLALHARVLEFIHPFTKEKLRFEVPEPAEWKKITASASAAN